MPTVHSLTIPVWVTLSADSLSSPRSPRNRAEGSIEDCQRRVGARERQNGEVGDSSTEGKEGPQSASANRHIGKERVKREKGNKDGKMVTAMEVKNLPLEIQVKGRQAKKDQDRKGRVSK